MKDFIALLKNNPEAAFGYIANEYANMDRSELADIICVLIRSIRSKDIENSVLSQAATELGDRYAYLFIEGE